MRILLGTTNPSKVKRFSDLLKGYDVEFVTLKDLAITDEPEENGTTPEENAIAKAKFYGQYFEVVICNDSGLYFEELALDDVRQPGERSFCVASPVMTALEPNPMRVKNIFIWAGVVFCASSKIINALSKVRPLM